MSELNELKQPVPNTHGDPHFQHLTDESYAELIRAIAKAQQIVEKIREDLRSTRPEDTFSIIEHPALTQLDRLYDSLAIVTNQFQVPNGMINSSHLEEFRDEINIIANKLSDLPEGDWKKKVSIMKSWANR